MYLANHDDARNRDIFLSESNPPKDECNPPSRLDRAAADKILVDHQPLVRNSAKKFQNQSAARGMSLAFEDLVQEANIALLVALQTFDPAKSKFGTYARRAIKWAFTKYLADNRSQIKRPRDAAQVADVSLNAPAYDFDGRIVEYGDLIEDESIPDPVDVIDNARRAAALADALKTLTPRERSILEARHLSDSDENWKLDTRLTDNRGPTRERFAKHGEPFRYLGRAYCGDLLTATPIKRNRRTLDAVGMEHGISGERARQIEARAYSKVEAHLRRGAA